MAQYKIIGGDGKEYGPISTEQVRQWIAQGRLTAQSRVQAEGSGDWKPLAEFPELQASCSGNVPPIEPAKTCKLAAASLILGCMSLICSLFAAIPGLTLGIVSLYKINRSRGTLTGKGLAIAGICVSGLFTLIGACMIIAVVIPSFVRTQDYARDVSCMNNMKQLGVAMKLYAEDNGGKLPDAARWCDAIQKYATENGLYRCRTTGTHYLFNRNLSGLELSRVSQADKTVLLFEGGGGWNAIGAAADLPAKPTHHSGCNVLFVDGHTERIPTERYKQLRWQADN